LAICNEEDTDGRARVTTDGAYSTVNMFIYRTVERIHTTGVTLKHDGTDRQTGSQDASAALPENFTTLV